MRYAFCEELTKLADKDKKIILLTGDLGFTLFENFQERFPKQFFNVGIAEPNMAGVAAGLALSGKIVFVYSIASFISTRAYEFIRNDVCVHKLPVIIVGSGAGFSYAEAGVTHFATQDIALMRGLANMTVFCPADPLEAQWATRIAVQLKSPVYLRLGKKGEPKIYNKVPKLILGRASQLTKGKDIAIIACGNIVANALKANKLLEKSKIKASVFSMHTVKPIDKKLIQKLAKKSSFLFTIEEHSEIGGLGSAVAEIISQESKSKAKLVRIAIPDLFPHKLGSQNYLRQTYGLSPQKIAKRILEFTTYKK